MREHQCRKRIPYLEAGGGENATKKRYRYLQKTRSLTNSPARIEDYTDVKRAYDS
jgi:hypothetical protein